MLFLGFGAKLAPQVPQREVVEGEAALPGPHQVGGQRGVGGDAGQRPATAGQVVHGDLGLVQRLRGTPIGQPVAERGLILRGQGGGVDIGALTAGGGDGNRRGIAVVHRVGAHHRHPAATSVAGVCGQPGPHRTGLQCPAAHLEAFVDLGFDGGQGVEQPVAQHPELEVVEQPVDLVTVPRQ